MKIEFKLSPENHGLLINELINSPPEQVQMELIKAMNMAEIFFDHDPDSLGMVMPLCMNLFGVWVNKMGGTFQSLSRPTKAKRQRRRSPKNNQ